MTDALAVRTQSTGDDMVVIRSVGSAATSNLYALVPSWIRGQGGELGRIEFDQGSSAADLSELGFAVQARLLGRILDWYVQLDEGTSAEDLSDLGVKWRERETYETSVEFVAVGRAEFRPLDDD